MVQPNLHGPQVDYFLLLAFTNDPDYSGLEENFNMLANGAEFNSVGLHHYIIRTLAMSNRVLIGSLRVPCLGR
jgi:hypothetical protein